MKVAKKFVDYYRKSLNPPYRKRDFWTIVGTILFLSILPLVVSPLSSSGQESQESDLVRAESSTRFASNEILIKLKKPTRSKVKAGRKPSNIGIKSLEAKNKQFEVKKFKRLIPKRQKENISSEILGWYQVTLPGKKKIIEGSLDKDSGKLSPVDRESSLLIKTLENYRSDPNVEVAEPNYNVHILATIPNDPYYSSSGSWGQSYQDLYGMHKIDAASAWDQTTGSANIIVADIDTGVDRNHEDLQGQMWTNSAETPGNGVDDDQNGYIDDYYGWDWVSNDPDPMDDHGHGTHTVGTIAGVGNNSIGVVGVNWTSKIMALKFLSAGGSGSLSNGIKALEYAADMGAKISSNSWGCACNSVAMDDAVKYEHDKGMVMVAAAGNSNSDAIDSSPSSADRAIAVAATDYLDRKASFSSWGEDIDVAAPGVDVLSLKASVSPMCTASRTVGTKYCKVSGTSMATPHVAGLAALLLAKNPNLTNEEIRQILRHGSDDLGAAGKDKNFGYGRINAVKSLNLSGSNPLTPVITSPKSRTLATGTSFNILGSVPGPNFVSYKIEVGNTRVPTDWTTLATSTTQVINGTLATINPTTLNDGLNILRVTATNTSGKKFQFQVHDITIDNLKSELTAPSGSVSKGVFDVVGSADVKNGLTLSSYKLEWGVGFSPSSYSTSGITLVNGGKNPVNNRKLGTWDTSALSDGQTYTLRLTVNATSGASSQEKVTVQVDKDLVAGWPKTLDRNNCGYWCWGTPTAADLNGDGTKEIIVGSGGNKIYAFNRDGSNYNGFPVTVTSGDWFNWPLNVDDLDGDGKKEIVAAAVTSLDQRRIYVIRNNGTFYPGWPNPIFSNTGDVDDITPSLADLNNDGQKEMVLLDGSGNIHAYRLDGTELPGFPKNVTSYAHLRTSSISVADLDNDNKLEILVAATGYFILLDNLGNILAGWPYSAPRYDGRSMVFCSTGASGDVDGDGDLEVVAIGRSCRGCHALIYVWEKNGTLLSGWPKVGGRFPNSFKPLNSPSLVDVDGDDKDEIIVGLDRLAIFDETGQKTISNPAVTDNAPAVGDVSGNGEFEILGIEMNRVSISRKDGSIYWQRINSNDPPHYFFDPGILTDLDSDGKTELSVVKTPIDDTGMIKIYLWEVPGANADADWPMFAHDPARTGRLLVGGSSPPPSDSEPPTVSITSPGNGDTVSGSVNFSATATDNVGVIKVEFRVGGGLKSTDTTSPYSYSWDTTAVSNGSYTLSTKAYDAAGNIGASPAITVNVSNADTTPPSVPTGVKARIRSSTRVDVTWNASSDNTTVKGYRVYRNGKLIATTLTNLLGFADRSVRAGNTYYYRVAAFDPAGNQSAKSAVAKVTIPSGTPKRKIGDLNSDGKINIRDLSILISKWGARRSVADINGDGRVNIRDLSILLSRWGK
jgi:subtilisin family serine protease